LRSGINVGEARLKSEEISGIAFHIEARIAGNSPPR
jgi:hypothetical protein